MSPASGRGTGCYIVVRDNIARGLWTPGTAIPTEEALREEFGVSRVTVRRALTDLAAQGLVERRHGLGTFVSANLHDLDEQPVQYINAYLSPDRSRNLSEIPGDYMNTTAGGQFVHDGV